eukprot:5455425-Pyramimonas_sp.AAC.1
MMNAERGVRNSFCPHRVPKRPPGEPEDGPKGPPSRLNGGSMKSKPPRAGPGPPRDAQGDSKTRQEGPKRPKSAREVSK